MNRINMKQKILNKRAARFLIALLIVGLLVSCQKDESSSDSKETNGTHQIIAKEKQALNFDTIKGKNSSANAITENLQLPLAGGNSTKIAWSSSNSAISSRGVVTRPSNENVAVTLTATISKENVSDKKEFSLIVIAHNPSDKESVAKAKESLVFFRIRGSNLSPALVTTDPELISNFINETTITWSTTHPNIISAEGKVTQPDHGTGNTQVTLTATISKGGYQDTREFVLTVPEQSPNFGYVTGPGGNEKTGLYRFGENKLGQLPVTILNGECYFEAKTGLLNLKTVDLNHWISGFQPFSSHCANNKQKAINGAHSPLNDAHYFGQVVELMFHDWLGVSPVPFQTVLRVHFNDKYENAFWNGSSMNFGDGGESLFPLTTLDITAHEIAHGFTEHNSGLIYRGESGGINEAFSDMAGEAAKYYLHGHTSFIIGEDVIKPGGPLGQIGFMRNMKDPEADGKSISHVKDFTEDLNVHYSSGIYNKVFYLLATTDGWNPKKAFQVFAKANRDYWGPTTGFQDGAEDVMDATEELGYPVADVLAAFQAVGLGSATGANPALAGAMDYPAAEWKNYGDKAFESQGEITKFGGDALRSGSVSAGQDSVLRTTVTGPGIASFFRKVSSDATYDHLTFYVNEKEQEKISGEVDWNKVAYKLEPGLNKLKWVYRQESGTGKGSNAAWLDYFQLDPIDQNLATALDNDQLDWITKGDANFFAQTKTFMNGGSAVQAGKVADYQSSTMTTYITGPATITFYWKVSSEETKDFFTFRINGEQQERISGEVDWIKKSYQLPSGQNELTWTYTKNATGSAGSDTAWVDLVSDIAVWKQGASMKQGRTSAGSAVYNNELYLFGGDNRGGNSVEKYNPATDRWTPLENLPPWSEYNRAVTVGDKIYVTLVDGEYFYEYDPAKDSWKQLSTLPMYMIAEPAVVNNKIYFFDSYRTGDANSANLSLEYDPAKESWRELPGRKVNSYDAATAVHNGKIYLLGGQITGEQTIYLKTMEVYDPIANTWESKADLPFSESGWGIAETIGDKIYWMGEKGTAVYDIATDTWKLGTVQPVPKYNPTAETINGKIHVVGGIEIKKKEPGFISVGGAKPSDKLYIYNPEHDTLVTP